MPEKTFTRKDGTTVTFKCSDGPRVRKPKKPAKDTSTPQPQPGEKRKAETQTDADEEKLRKGVSPVLVLEMK